MNLTDISIIDVGHGNSSILHGNNETIIIDCGAKGAGLLQFLQERKITDIKAVYLSHADQDHIGGLLTLLASEEIKIQSVYLNSDGSKGTKIWDDLVTILDFRSRNETISFEVSIHSELEHVDIGDLRFDVVGPSKYLVAKAVGSTDRKGRKITSNSISASFIISYKNKPMVFLSGDIDQVGLDEIVYMGKSIKAGVLVFPHHGGKIEEGDVVTFTKQLLAITESQTVVFSIGRKRFKNPRPEIIQAVKQSGSKIRIACTQLSENCSNLLPKLDPTHLHPYYSKGKYLKECCSGTYVISFEDKINEFPEYTSHQTFISTIASSPLCR